MRSAEICHIGARRNDTSLSTSTSVPPRPNIISGPNRGSRLAPRITSTPLRAICFDEDAFDLGAGHGLLARS